MAGYDVSGFKEFIKQYKAHGKTYETKDRRYLVVNLGQGGFVVPPRFVNLLCFMSWKKNIIDARIHHLVNCGRVAEAKMLANIMPMEGSHAD